MNRGFLIADGLADRMIETIRRVESTPYGTVAGGTERFEDWGRRGGGSAVRLGTVDATWFKNEEATVTQIKGDGSPLTPTVTFTAKNWFASVIVITGTKKVACAKVGDWWILIAAECG